MAKLVVAFRNVANAPKNLIFLSRVLMLICCFFRFNLFIPSYQSSYSYYVFLSCPLFCVLFPDQIYLLSAWLTAVNISMAYRIGLFEWWFEHIRLLRTGEGSRLSVIVFSMLPSFRSSCPPSCLKHVADSEDIMCLWSGTLSTDFETADDLRKFLCIQTCGLWNS